MLPFKRSLPYLFVISGIILLLFLVGFIIFDQRVKNPVAAVLPDKIGGIPLTTALYGPEASVEVRRLHGKDFLVTSAAVGVYGDSGQITLWLTGTPLSLFASDLIDSMEKKIAEGNSPFKPISIQRLNNRIVHKLDGLGLKHFYFRSGSDVIWVAVNEELVDGVLEECLDIYP